MHEAVPNIDVPEVGDMVRYRGGCYTVAGWLRTAPQGDVRDGGEGVACPLLFATRANATHLRIRGAGAGVAVARLADVEATGDRALFAPNTVRAAHRIAGFLDGQPTEYYESESVEG